MDWEKRIKYMQGGTGQVFYLFFDEESKVWVITIWTPPDPPAAIGCWATREEAEECMTRMDCKEIKH